jgi:integrase
VLAANVKPVHSAGLYATLRTEPITYRQLAIEDWRAERARARGQAALRKQRPPRSPVPTSALRMAHGMNLVARNVIHHVPKDNRPKPTTSPARPLSPAQVVELLKAAEKTRLHAFFVTAVMTGMRRGELGALTWTQLTSRRARQSCDEPSAKIVAAARS